MESMHKLNNTTSELKKQFPRNAFFQVLSFGTQVLVGIWMIPYLVSNLGTAAYGLIPIAGLLTQYVNLISDSISSSLNRFLIFALNKKNYHEANIVFSTAFFIYCSIALIEIPFFLLFINYANVILVIPQALYNDLVVLLICSVGTFLINLVASVFASVLFSVNRLDILRAFDIFRIIFRSLGIVIIFSFSRPALRYIGYVYLLTAGIIFLFQAIAAKRLQPQLCLKFKCFDFKKIRSMINLSGWVFINQLGALLFLRTDVWICNKFIDPSSAGQYAALVQWPSLIRQGGLMISSLFAPMIMIYYAKSETWHLIRLSKSAIQILSFLLTIPISILCVASPTILSIWLGCSFVELAPLLFIMLFHLVINVGLMPLFSIQIAMNKVKLPALVTLFTGLINLLISIFVTKYLNFGLYGVAIVGAVILTAKNAFFTPFYVARILNQPHDLFFKSTARVLFLFGILIMLGKTIYLLWQPLDMVSLIFFSTTMTLIGLILGWFFLPHEALGMVDIFIRWPFPFSKTTRQ